MLKNDKLGTAAGINKFINHILEYFAQKIGHICLFIGTYYSQLGLVTEILYIGRKYITDSGDRWPTDFLVRVA